MKKLIILLIVSVLTGCEREGTEKFFDPGDLLHLDLADLSGFWSDPAVLDTSWYITASFESDPAYLDGIRVSGNERGVAVSVFDSDSAAIRAMEMRRNLVACVILPGLSDEMENTWWYSACIPHMVFINQWNTIIEVSYYAENYEMVEDLLLDTGKEVAERIDRKSHR